MEKNKFYHTDFLVPKMSFLTGMGSALCIGGDYYQYNISRSAPEADRKAIQSDWENVGQDIKQAIGKYKELIADETE